MDDQNFNNAGQPNNAPGTNVAPSPAAEGSDATYAPTNNDAVAPPPPSTVASSPQENGDTGANPKAYLVKYILSLIATGVLITLVISFFSGIVDSIGTESAGSGWMAKFAYQSSLGKISAAIVFSLALWFMARQCYATEKTLPAVKSNRWRKGFLGVFLVILGISALIAGATLVYNVVSLIASIGIADIDGVETTKSIVNSTFSTFVLTATAILYAKDYTSSRMSPLARNAHHYGLLISIVVLTVLFVALPLQAQRNSFIDNIASNDIETLESKISSYVRSENELPEELSDLELDEKVEKRLDNYDYTSKTSSYEICAEFRTDTTEEESSSGNPLEDVLTGPSYTGSSSSEDDPDHHQEGRQCFEYEAFGVGSYDRSNLFDSPQGLRQNEGFNTSGQTN